MTLLLKLKSSGIKNLQAPTFCLVFNMTHLKKRCLELVIIRNNVAQFWLPVNSANTTENHNVIFWNMFVIRWILLNVTGEKVKNSSSKMDSRIGLDYIVENAEYTTKLGAGKMIFLIQDYEFKTYKTFFSYWFNISCLEFFFQLLWKFIGIYPVYVSTMTNYNLGA